ncbi:aromatic acid exporter family protein [Streptomyces humi]|uniref:aromatic acid exporter family protein n=1 Tax=Streptomyces humi TaxID=1428620 RepID=UPI0006289859|nr:aromatic acid exporter family protein [Streptomyces humi]
MTSFKTLIAASLTWAVTAPWSAHDRPYLAVATALLMVNASTIYRSVTQAARNISTKLAGLLLALTTTQMLGPTAGAVAVIALVAVLAGPRRNTEDRLQSASTAVIALATTATDPIHGLVLPVSQTLTGTVVGITVNALVLPPLRLSESDSAVRDLARAMGTLLTDMGDGLARRQLTSKAHTWLYQARRLEQRLANTAEHVRQTDESLRWNPRCAARTRSSSMPYGKAFTALRGVSLQVRGIARTLADNAHDSHADHHLGQQFLDKYAHTLRLTGAAVREFARPSSTVDPADADAREQLREAIDTVVAWHQTMTDLIGHGTLVKPGAWHFYGSLMIDMERLLADLDHADRHWTPRPARTSA